MKAKTIKGKSAAEIQSALRDSMSDGYRPTLAVVFISIQQDRKAVCEMLSQQGIDVLGATSCGEFINGHQSEGDADALLVFSCAGRAPALGPLVTLENEGLAEVWNSPMAGFFTYGEFGRMKNGRQHFHSTACCWVALKERQSQQS
jgi:hypothetical protein